jgi:hypothetical protein
MITWCLAYLINICVADKQQRLLPPHHFEAHGLFLLWGPIGTYEAG